MLKSLKIQPLFSLVARKCQWQPCEQRSWPTMWLFLSPDFSGDMICLIPPTSQTISCLSLRGQCWMTKVLSFPLSTPPPWTRNQYRVTDVPGSLQHDMKNPTGRKCDALDSKQLDIRCNCEFLLVSEKILCRPSHYAVWQGADATPAAIASSQSGEKRQTGRWLAGAFFPTTELYVLKSFRSFF